MTLPTTTAEGSLTLAEENLARTWADCARWQSIVAAKDEIDPEAITTEQALARIYIDALPSPRDDDDNLLETFTAEQLAALRPFILIGQPPRSSYRAERVATDTYADAGSFVSLFEFSVDAEDREDLSEAFRKIKNDLGVMLDQAKELSYLPGYLAIDRFQVDGPFRCEDDDVNQLGDHVFALVTTFWNGGLPA